MTQVGTLPLIQWLVFNEIAASADDSGRAVNDPNLLLSALPVTEHQLAEALRQLESKRVLTVSGPTIFLLEPWIEWGAIGDVQIEGVKRWGVRIVPNVNGFLLRGTDFALRAGAEFRKKDSPPKNSVSGIVSTTIPEQKPREGNARVKSPSLDEGSGSEEGAGTGAAPRSEPEGGDGGCRSGEVMMPEGVGLLPEEVSSERVRHGGYERRNFMPEVRCPAAFMRFWDVYPRHDRKDDAIRQWNRAIDCGESAEEIILGAERYGEFARKNNQQSYRLFQAHNFIRGASYNESWGSSWTPRPKRSSSPLIHAHLIVTFKAEQPDWSFELWSNMHPDAAKIQCVSPGRFTLNDQVIYYDYQASIFKSYEECFDTHRDGTPYHGPYWWKTPEGKALMRQRRVLNPPLTGN